MNGLQENCTQALFFWEFLQPPNFFLLLDIYKASFQKEKVLVKAFRMRGLDWKEVQVGSGCCEQGKTFAHRILRFNHQISY